MFGPIRDISKDVLNLAGAAVAFSLFAILAFIAWAFVFVAIPAANREPMLMLMGLLTGQIGQVVAFFYGTSYGSQKKTDAIEKLTRGQ